MELFINIEIINSIFKDKCGDNTVYNKTSLQMNDIFKRMKLFIFVQLLKRKYFKR